MLNNLESPSLMPKENQIRRADGRITIAVCGYGRSGKDTAGEFLGRITGLKFAGSTSWIGLPHMAEVLQTAEQLAWERRHENRQRWKDELDAYRLQDPARLIREGLERGCIITGIRDKIELLAAVDEGLLTHTIWIESNRVPVDSTVTFAKENCDWVILNNDAIHDFHEALTEWAIARNLTPVCQSAAA